MGNIYAGTIVQVVRWVKRSFDKGDILDFNRAVCEKINEIIADLKPTVKQTSFFPTPNLQSTIRLFNNSCLASMPTLLEETYDVILTSPPYCNRYDYTRTYALELALLGIDEKGLSGLRQEMISCTVENRPRTY